MLLDILLLLFILLLYTCTHEGLADIVKTHVVFQVPHSHDPQNAQASCNVKSDVSFLVLHTVLIVVLVFFDSDGAMLRSPRRTLRPGWSQMLFCGCKTVKKWRTKGFGQMGDCPGICSHIHVNGLSYMNLGRSYNVRRASAPGILTPLPAVENHYGQTNFFPFRIYSPFSGSEVNCRPCRSYSPAPLTLFAMGK